MKKSTRFFALCLALTMCATMAMTGALGEVPQPTDQAAAVVETTEAPAEATAVPPTPGPDDVMATVNGETVTFAKLQEAYSNLYYQISSQGYDLTGQEALLQSMAMDNVVSEILFRQKAAEFKIDQFTAEEDAAFKAEAETTWNTYLDQQASSYLTSATPTDEEKANARKQAEDYFLQMGYSTEKAMEELITYYKDQKIQERMVELLTKDNAALTDADIQTEYQTRVDADKASFSEDVMNYIYAAEYTGQQVWYTPEGIRGITHILLAVDQTLLDNYNAIQAQLEEQASEEAAETTAEATATPDPAITPDPAATATPAPVTEADLEAAKNAILDSIKDKTEAIKTRYAAGEDFSALIAEFGTDPGMTEEPFKTEGYSVLANSIGFYPVFVQAAFSPEMQKIGDLSLPVVSTKGVHILRYTRDVPSGPVELTEALKTTLRTELEQTRKSDALPKALEEWKAAASIVYTQQESTEAPVTESTQEPTPTPAP